MEASFKVKEGIEELELVEEAVVLEELSQLMLVKFKVKEGTMEPELAVEFRVLEELLR